MQGISKRYVQVYSESIKNQMQMVWVRIKLDIMKNGLKS
jgi:hypothetical protein